MHRDPQHSTGLRHQLNELMHEQRQLIESLQQGQAHFRQLARSVWRVQEDERRRLAHELHDGIGHNLTAMIHLIANSLATLSATPQARPALDALARAHALAESTLQDTRAMSRLLRPQVLDDLGLESALRWLVRTLSETHPLDIRLDFNAPHDALDNDRATLVFRVAQESLANTARHACATRVEVAFDCDGEQAKLRIQDNGHGCDVQAALAAGTHGSSSGLGGMRDRVRLFGGTLHFESALGRGFRMEATLPLRDPAGGHAA